jgi:hypothetical protein
MQNHSTHLTLMLAAVVGFFLLAAFGVPVLSYLPVLAIFGFCMLMMVFMMRGMGHGSRDDENADTARSAHRH